MLSPRLLSIAKFVSKGSKVADIGTDHGLIPVYLAKCDISHNIIATDISPGSLKKAEDIVKKEMLGKYIETRLSNGIESIDPGEVDTIIVAGMGGILIRDILEVGFSLLGSISTLILQPMSNSEPLRRWLFEKGFHFKHESLVKEGNFIYEIMVLEHGSETLKDPVQFEVGFRQIYKEDPLFLEFIAKKIAKLDYIIDELRGKGKNHTGDMIRKHLDRINKYNEVLKWSVQ